MNQADAGKGRPGFFQSTTMDEVALSLSGLAAMAILAFSAFMWLERSVSGAGYGFLVVALLGIQTASAAFALGVACLLRSIGSVKAWVGVSLGAGVLLAEATFICTTYSKNF